MFVACPNCGFLVATNVGTSKQCPRCGSAIDARAAKPVPPTVEEEAAAEPVHTNNPTDNQTDNQVDARAETQTDNEAAPTDNDAAPGTPADTTETASESPSAEVVPTPTRPRRKRHHAPSFVHRHAPARVGARSGRGWWIVITLGLLLVLQLLLAQRDQLAADARWRPLISGLCSVAQCEVPAWHEPSAFTMLQRNVQPKPGSQNVLRVSASFRNDARWPQPWPTVMLTLSDMDGRTVGQRAFRPDEYRGGSAGRIAPGQSASLQFDVVEPAQRVVAFTFDFL